MITEHLMRPGSGSINLIDPPLSLTKAILDLVAGAGCHIVIVPGRTAVAGTTPVIGDSATLASAIYTGRVVGRPSRSSLEFEGLGSWLDSYNDTAITRSAGTVTQWLGDLLVNGLSTGTVAGGSTVSRTFAAYAQTRREALDAVIGLAGAEYEIRPNFTVNAGTSVWSTTPKIVITDKTEGPDGVYWGLAGGLLDQEIDIGSQATKAAALAEGAGAAIAVGTATQTLALKDKSGNTPVLVAVLSAPSEPSANATTVATNWLALQNLRRQVKMSTTTRMARTKLRPGDYVYLWDVLSGLIDTTNQILYRGATIFPAKVRCLSMSWPIEKGFGVYIRSNAATPTYHDITPYVEWEDPGAFVEVGDWHPPAYGRSNRSNPEVEGRVAGSATGWTDITLSSANWTIVRQPQWRTENDRVWLRGTITRTTSTFAPTGAFCSLGGANPTSPTQIAVLFGVGSIAAATPAGAPVSIVIDPGGGTIRTASNAPSIAVGDNVSFDGISYPLA